MNLFSNFHLKILILIESVKLCYSCGPNYDPLTTKKIHPDWFAAIFFQPHQNVSKIDYEFKCLGAVINSKIVAVSALCVPMGFQDIITVRFYDWTNNRNITKHVAYDERSVSEMMNFHQLYPGEIGKNDVNLLVLSKPKQLNSFITVKNTGFYQYNRQYYESEYYIKNCIFIDSKGNMNSGYDVKFEYVVSIYKSKCCEFYGFPNPDDFTLDDRCKLFLFEINCFRIKDNNNQSYAHYNPLICQDDDDDNPYLYGFLIDKTNDQVRITTFEENRPWINEVSQKYG